MSACIKRGTFCVREKNKKPAHAPESMGTCAATQKGTKKWFRLKAGDIVGNICPGDIRIRIGALTGDDLPGDLTVGKKQAVNDGGGELQFHLKVADLRLFGCFC